ncbi:MAG: phasin family protein [Rhodomicrobium sp.]
MTDNPFEIPQAMRDLAETNIKQAHAVYDRLTDFISETIDTWVDAIPANPVAEGFMYVQDRATEIAMENADAASEFVSQISDAQTFEDIVMLETRFVQNRMQAFVAQTQQLYGLIGEALQASALGAAGAGTGAMPSNPLITGLADVHNRAEEIAKMNADSAFALAEKIAKAQTLQDILTLQTQFAQEQMQAYAAQTEGLQGLIGNAFRKP